MSFYIGREASKYIHGLAARGVHYIHRPGPTLQDVGFFLLPELGQDKGYISESVFTTLSVFCLVDIPSFHFQDQKDLYSSDMVQGLGFLSFPRGVLYDCSDLIFSSHMIFSVVFVWTYHKYGTRRFIKLCSWLAVIAQSILIVASLKHYTVDVVVAWYTVKQLPGKDKEFSEALSPALSLPLSKGSETKEENHKLLNENSGDPAEWV
ncbi:hypothetical protein RND71_035761 [Anisodus tanguticus]|uniref:Sphingomyelin synthase-like domain-containing protein n=1 Tax=Anisodus tanguticus TaxID=243964 RepID=A0AAE1R5N1_9SOLA|nr:hypothetical protein RND71_035761 [Anisodus tanguticus]